MSTPSSEAGVLQPGQQFGRYQIIRRLGAGGMGAVYLATDTRLRRNVALKVCMVAANAEASDRFRREAQAAAALRHTNLCPVYDFDVHDGIAFITMAHIDGPSLEKWLQTHPLDFRSAALLVRKLAMAMQAAHEGGVIHRDLKPLNIGIDGKGEPVILDFGLARLMDAQTKKTQQGAIFGTLAYMSPEQAGGETDAIGPATDIFTLGGCEFIEPPCLPIPRRGVNLQNPSSVSGPWLRAFCRKPANSALRVLLALCAGNLCRFRRQDFGGTQTLRT